MVGSRKTWLTTGALVAAALALVAGALLTRPQSGPESARPDEAKPATEITATVEGSPGGASDTPAGANIGTPTPGGAGQPQRGDEKASSPGEGTPSSAPPAAPVAEGRALETLGSPPEATVAMLDASAATPDSRYEVAFRPYGQTRGGGVVVLVRDSTSLGNVPKPFQFEGRNVLVAFESPTEAEVVTEGGDYRGIVQLRENRGVLVPVLLSVERGD